MCIFRMGAVNAQRYLYEVIRCLIILQMIQVGAQFIYLHDSPLCHRMNILKTELDISNIICLPWPTHTPDLNPIEQGWDMLERVIHNNPEQPQTFVALKNTFWACWVAIAQSDYSRLITSIRYCVEMCIEAVYGNTHC